MINNDKLKTRDVIWKLSDLYHDTSDPTIATDIAACEQEAARLNQEFSGRLEAVGSSQLHELVNGLETVATRLGKLATFAYLNFATQTANPEAGAFLQKIREAASRIGRDTIFFELQWNGLAENIATEHLQAPELAHYQHYLTSMRRYAAHLLSQTEETLLLEIAPVGRGSWTNLFDKVMGHLKFGVGQRSEEEVLADLYSPDREVRRIAAEEMTNGLRSQSHILSHIFNTILADKMIEDRLRRYESWIGSMNLYNELTDDTVEVLIKAATARYDIAARYYRLKRELLGLDELFDYDRYAPLPHLPDTVTDWDQCRATVLKAFGNFSPQLSEIAEKFFTKNWIHAPVEDNKRGGAFAHPCIPEAHPYIMVNYTGNSRDVSTVAHELGHGVHQYLAADQGYFNSNTPLVLAETASVFAELLVFNDQLRDLADPAAQKAFVCNKLESIFATVFRQLAMNRFEDRIHNARKTAGELSTEEFSRHWLETQQEMFGDSVTLTDNYGIWWSYIPHFLNSPGYVYSYAFGELLVLALYKLYQQDGTDFVPKYITLLAAGGSQSPYELLRPFGVDLNDPEFWHGGLEIIDAMLRSVEA